MNANAKPSPIELVFITGLSGSGKSTVAKCFEDLGYYCIENLPPSLLRTFLRNPVEHVGDIERVAVVTDVRAPGIAAELPRLLDEIDRDRVRPTLLFLDTSDESLVRRFSETRRSHPLATSQALIDAIRQERELLSELRGVADVVFDTSEWSIHEIRSQIYKRFGEAALREPHLIVWLNSFGFKHGIPYGSDLLFDVRFLNNPYFEPELRELTGRDRPVLDFLESHSEFPDFLDRLSEFLLYLLPRFASEHRSYLSVSIGCTGGRHRSVAICEQLSRRLVEAGHPSRLNHRDIDK